MRGGRFSVGFLLAALIIAGGLSYLASSDPDGLDSVTLHGCQVVDVGGAEQLQGECIAQHARDSVTAGSPLADYSILGSDGSVGPAGVIGVLVTAVIAGSLFWLLRRRADTPSDR
jgi:cobalt/nickel transport protein